MRAFRRFLVPAVIVAMAMSIATARAAGPRLVSLNLCTDQLALALADPGQIVALSRFASDPSLSPVVEMARRFPVVHGAAEEALALAPDLVLAGPYDRPVASGMLARQGVRIAVLDLWQDFPQGEQGIRAIAGIIGHPERGDRLVARIEAARAAAAGTGRGRSVLALGRGGYVDGTKSLTGLLLEAVGLRNLAADRTFGGFMPLERILTLQPDILVLADEGEDGTDRGAAFLRHPALLAWRAGRKIVELPPQLTACGGPALVEALGRLAAVLDE